MFFQSADESRCVGWQTLHKCQNNLKNYQEKKGCSECALAKHHLRLVHVALEVKSYCEEPEDAMLIHECVYCSHVTGGRCPTNHDIHWSVPRSGNIQACCTHVHTHTSTPTHTAFVSGSYVQKAKGRSIDHIRERRHIVVTVSLLLPVNWTFNEVTLHRSSVLESDGLAFRKTQSLFIFITLEPSASE